ncbi:hypothetical protein OSTOST_05118, partial [Ostertagia ostertagi]
AIHIYGTSIAVLSNGIFYGVKPWGFLSLCAFIGMYGVTTALLTLHFVYRYIVVCSEHYYKYANASIYTKYGVDANELSFFCVFTHEVPRTGAPAHNNTLVIYDRPGHDLYNDDKHICPHDSLRLPNVSNTEEIFFEPKVNEDADSAVESVGCT